MSQPEETEQRTEIAEVELREIEGGGKIAAGYAVKFNSPTKIGNAWVEKFAPGAFRTSLTKDDQLAFFSHDFNRVLGRRSSGTLRLAEDARGLTYEIDLPDTSDGRDLAVLVKRKDIKGASFGFRAMREEWDETTKPPTRTIFEAQLIEISPTARPAYGDTSIGLRSLTEAKRSRAAENFSAAQTRLRLKADLDLRVRR